MFNVLLPLLGVGLFVIGTIVFWSAIQNWLSDFLAQASEKLGTIAYTAQNALIILDRVMVNGQRLYAATVHIFFTENTTHEQVRVEEVKMMAREDLPADILAKLDAGEKLEYTLAVGNSAAGSNVTAKSETPKDAPTTYRLVVRSSD